MSHQNNSTRAIALHLADCPDGWMRATGAIPATHSKDAMSDSLERAWRMGVAYRANGGHRHITYFARLEDAQRFAQRTGHKLEPSPCTGDPRRLMEIGPKAQLVADYCRRPGGYRRVQDGPIPGLSPASESSYLVMLLKRGAIHAGRVGNNHCRWFGTAAEASAYVSGNHKVIAANEKARQPATLSGALARSAPIDMSRARITICRPTQAGVSNAHLTAELVFSAMRPGQYLEVAA